jgi:hypothetical protein
VGILPSEAHEETAGEVPMEAGGALQVTKKRQESEQQREAGGFRREGRRPVPHLVGEIDSTGHLLKANPLRQNTNVPSSATNKIGAPPEEMETACAMTCLPPSEAAPDFRSSIVGR